MDGLTPQPTTADGSNQVFDRAGAMYRDVFTEAKGLGVKMCLGTETPLILPRAVQERLRGQGRDPNSPAVKEQIYEGIFRRVAAADPVDYYWLWTPENWTWLGNTPAQFRATTDDIQAAMDALQAIGHPFQLATCGWVLGPQNDRAARTGFCLRAYP